MLIRYIHLDKVSRPIDPSCFNMISICLMYYCPECIHEPSKQVYNEIDWICDPKDQKDHLWHFVDSPAVSFLILS